MNIRCVPGAALAAVAFSVAMTAAAYGSGETVTPNFDHAISKVPGKSLIAVLVEYAPGGHE